MDSFVMKDADLYRIKQVSGLLSVMRKLAEGQAEVVLLGEDFIDAMSFMADSLETAHNAALFVGRAPSRQE